MLFNGKSAGVEISPTGLAFALLEGSQASPSLERLAFRPLAPGVLRPSLREPNILDGQAFSDKLREAHALLLHRGLRLSVSLPDSVGKVVILDLQERFKSRTEGLDIIRWKLKKNLPFDISDCHLDYQILNKRENGELVLLVTLVSRSVLEQYESLINGAGLSPVNIDLNAFNLYRAFERNLSPVEEGGLISFYGSTLGIMFFFEGIPEFTRFKELSGTLDNAGRIYTEISSSLLVYRERFPERQVKNLHCIASPGLSRDFCDMLEELGGVKPVLLEAKSAVKPSKDAPANQETLFPYTAAIGAALRSL